MAFTPIDESEILPATGTGFSGFTPISDDEILTVDPLTGGETFAGGFADLLGKLTLGAGDEIVAGGSSIIDALRGDNIFNAYDSRLSQVRDLQSRYAEENPISSLANNAAGFLMPMPKAITGTKATATTEAVPGIFSTAKGIKPALGNIGKGAGIGAGYGSIAGFLSGEGVQDRIGGALEGGALGAATGGVLQAGIEGIQGAANTLGKWAPSMARSAIGARQGDYAKTANDLGTIELPDGDLQTLTKTAVDDLLAANTLGASREPSEMLVNINAAEDEAIKAVDDIIKGFGQKVQPNFEGARRYLEEGKVPADKIEAYLKRLAKLEAKIKSEGKGRLTYLQQQKIAQGKMYDPNDSVLNGFNRAIYHDLQRTIERAVPEVAGANSWLQKIKLVKPIIQRGMAGDEAANPVKAFIESIKTSGGFGVPIITGSLIGGVPGAMLGGTAAFAGAKLASPAGKKLAAELMASAPSKTTGAAKALGALPGIAQAEANFLESLEENPELSTQPIELKAPIQDLPSLNSDSDYIASKVKSAEEKLSMQAPKIISAKKTKSAPEDSFEALAKAVIHQESGGDPDAVSRAGAVGLMQVMPATAKEIAKELGIKKYDLKDPETNRQFGEYYLKKMLKMFDGDIELALTAYNQGPGRVKKLLTLHNAKTLKEIRPYLGPDGRAYARSILTRLKKDGVTLV